jgi:hypothetical protein
MKMDDFDICNKKKQWISPLKEICNNINIKINLSQMNGIFANYL